MRIQSLSLAGLASSVSAVNLYASSYAGTVTSLALTKGYNGSYSLQAKSTVEGCGVDPAWVTLDSEAGVLYCSDEAINNRDSVVTSYSTSESGVLEQIATVGTIWGPVASVLYANRTAIAQAHYLGSSVTTLAIKDGELQTLENFTFTQNGPGPDPDRQDAPHPHQVILDPTESFIIVPDLGSDLLRIFAINEDATLTPATPYRVVPGSGPRHGAFVKTGDATWFFLISELANTVTSFHVGYSNGSLSFTEVFTAGTYGNMTTPTGAAAAELLISPDLKFLHTSSRFDELFQLPNFDPSNSTLIPSDSLASWSIDAATGSLSFIGLAAAGGRVPRQFSLNAEGSLAAVALQSDGTVTIVERDVETGVLGSIVATVDLGAVGVNTVVWDE
ncbi:3-carboxymuconate cyclase-like protein-like protein [Elsinoe ampelina]|uniref:3-carboxymuconate cyclase-like protein-like protein n=1 Tax=Elsinoe ampelina TaxID=302913 RepID=A0A6A6FXN9_9PEZI|nr:3-carboxymuconate cyclase-like protein-like protein [Elsinoe ampelina]